MHGSRLFSWQAWVTSLPSLVPISVGTKTTLPESPSTCGWSVDMSLPRIWSMLTTFLPAEMASWTPVMRPVPKIGWTMIAS